MTMKSIFAGLLAFCFLVTSCKKESVGGDETPPVDENTETPVGIPLGNAVSKKIGAQGGELTSPDGTVKIIIPAGALTEEKEISIQPITSELPSAIGNAYRLTPHGTQFAKPVSIVFNYKVEDLENTLPEFLDIAFQDNKGSWQAMVNATVDKAAKQVRVQTTHFSDWTYFKSIELDPSEATVELGGAVELKVTTTFPYVDPDDAPPGWDTRPVYTAPRLLRADEIEGWEYQGDGILVHSGPKAFYTAPEQLPSVNPEAVAVKINMARKGKFMLISNITILSSNKVEYLQVDEDYVKPGNEASPWLYLYGSFGNDPGVGKRSVKINGTEVPVHFWLPNMIRCKIDRQIHGAIEIIAKGKTIATSVLRKFTGTFLYERYHGGVLNAGSGNPLKETTKFTLVYRGFGKPCPEDLEPMFPVELALAEGSQARFTLQGSATITTPGDCPLTSSVVIPPSSGIQTVNPMSVAALTGFKAEVIEKENGIDIQFFYFINDVATGIVISRSNCQLSWNDPPSSYGVSLAGFHQPISFEFFGTTELKLRGKDELKSLPMGSAILGGAWDGSSNHYETDGLMPATFKNGQ